jgi:hypothetical protein
MSPKESTSWTGNYVKGSNLNFMYPTVLHFGSAYTGHQMMEALGPGQIVFADQLDYTVP